MYTFVWFSAAIWETPSKKTAVILSHLYVIGVKIVLRAYVGAEGILLLKNGTLTTGKGKLKSSLLS